MNNTGIPSAAGTHSERMPARRQCPLNAEESSIYLVRFLHSSEVMLCRYDEQPLHPGQAVVAPSRYGKDLARIVSTVNESCAHGQESIMSIVRLADEQDLAEYRKNQSFESDALVWCRQRADLHELDMKVLSAHRLPEENKLLFFFTADGRVDFRELVHDLVATYRMRIELRQIGVRDETRLLGGIGVCGRVLCCHSYPAQMCSVSIKMAKEQNLSLGSMKVSGPCGRLMCCLSYEYDFYSSERINFPRPGTNVTGSSTSYVVSEVNMISRNVVLTQSDGGTIGVNITALRLDPVSRRWTVDLPPANDA